MYICVHACMHGGYLLVRQLVFHTIELLPEDCAEDLVELTTLKVAYNKMGRKQAEFNHFITSAPV